MWRRDRASVLAKPAAGDIQRLDGGAALVWLALDRPLDRDALAAELRLAGEAGSTSEVDALAPVPPGAAGVDEALELLAAAGLVTEGPTEPGGNRPPSTDPTPAAGAEPHSDLDVDLPPTTRATAGGSLPTAIAAWGVEHDGPIASDRSSAEVGAAVDTLVRWRMAGLATTLVDDGLLDLDVESTDFERLAEAATRDTVIALFLDERLLAVADLLGRHGVSFAVLKGAASAHLDHPEPQERAYSDIDLLVRADHLDRTVALLTGDGCRRSWPERRPGFDRRFAKSVTLTGPDGYEIDLHRTLTDGRPGARIPLDDLFARRTTFEVAGVVLPALVAEHRALHAAYHVALGSAAPPIRSLRDLALHLARPHGSPERLRPVLAAWRGEAVMARAVRLLFENLPVELAPWRAWLDGVDLSDSEVALVERQVRRGSGLGAEALDAVLDLPWRRRGPYLAAIAYPTRQHLRARGLTRRDHLGKMVGRARSFPGPTQRLRRGRGRG